MQEKLKSPRLQDTSQAPEFPDILDEARPLVGDSDNRIQYFERGAGPGGAAGKVNYEFSETRSAGPGSYPGLPSL